MSLTAPRFLRRCTALMSLAIVWPITACRPQAGIAHPAADLQTSARNRALLAEPPRETTKAVWDSLTRPANILVNPPSYTGRIVRNALYVRFQRDSSTDARVKALARISAEVIGGHRMPGTDGYYLIRVPTPESPGDSTSGPLFRARRQLDADPSVRSTLLVVMDRLL